MQEVYGIAAFRSRQQVLMLESALRRQGLSVGVITTPRDQSGGHLSGERVCLRARQTYASGQLFGKLIFVFRRRGGGKALDRAAFEIV